MMHRFLNTTKTGKRLILVLVVVMTAAAGVHFLAGSHAATPFVAIEPENGTLSDGSVIASAGDASGGKFVQYSPGNNSAGTVRFFKNLDSRQDGYTNNPSAASQAWMRQHWQRGLVYTPYFNSRLSWFPNGWVYLDSYAIYPNQPEIVNQHPDWILKSRAGKNLYIAYACNGTSCSQYAADFGNPQWRQHYIDYVKSAVATGYKGVMVDDVNLDFRISDGTGNFVTPIDPRTGTEMTIDNWRKYFAEFMEELRRQVPNTEIVHNSVWFAGNNRDNDPYVIRQIQASDLIYMERGMNDSGLTGGTGQWSVNAYFAFMDHVHALGKHVIFVGYPPTIADAEYNLAGYFLMNNGGDYVGSETFSNEDNWWHGYDRNLGNATSGRYSWNGLLRRDFSGGMVLLNEPGSPNRTVALDATYKDTTDKSVTSVTISAGRGAVLVK